MNIFITGTSRGIGHALADFYSKENTVYGISRGDTNLPINHKKVDLADFDNLQSTIQEWIKEVSSFDLVFLNAGILGEIQSIKEASLSELKQTMDINLWAQKLLLDALLEKEVQNIIAISSGASKSGNFGWSGYSLSKAALNMLIQLYANEFKQTKFIALAPGLVDTNMQEIISTQDAQKFPSLKRLQESRGTDNMPTPQKFVELFNEKSQEIFQVESGSFIDIRKI